MSRFDEIQAFVQIVEAGSITMAAEHLGLGKSAVSKRLAELEERLGVELFHRTTRRLNLTDSGTGFYQRSKQILDDLIEAENSVSQAHQELRGELKIAAPLSFGVMHLGPAINEFSKQHPAIQFDIDFNDRQVDLLQEGFDLGIRIAELDDSSLMARKIAPVSLVVCASPEYLDKYGEPQSPDDLAQHNCLSYRYLANAHQWTFIGRDKKSHSVKIKSQIQANNGDYLRQAAIEGLGIVRQPTFIAYQSILKGELIPILQDYSNPGLNAYAIYPPTRHLSQRVRRFIDALVERFSGTPYWDTCLETRK